MVLVQRAGGIETVVRNLPFIKFKIAAELVFSVGCNNGPITIAGFMVTMSIPFSFTNFQAASSANVFESTYHCCETRWGNVKFSVIFEKCTMKQENLHN